MMNSPIHSPAKRAKQFLFWMLGLFTVVVVVIVGVVATSRTAPPLQSLDLGDGRILQIEQITYGTKHRAGKDSPFKRVQPWLPGGLHRFLELDRQADDITLDRPGLVVWVNAISKTGRTNVDCQAIKVEFTDQHGDLFGDSTRSWFGGQDFWRVGHIFYCYPREERELNLRVTTWRKGVTTTGKILNPKPGEVASWAGESLPQKKRLGEFELSLTDLTVRTNGLGQKGYYETAARYFEPVMEVKRAGVPVAGWSKPEWIAESPNGNRGQFLGVHQAALRFTATVYPESTNATAAKLIATLPPTDFTTLKTNQWWNATNSVSSNSVVVLGMFLRGTHSFADGHYQSSSASVNGPGGGAPSGWTWDSKQITPFRETTTHNHYTPSPVIYVQVGEGSGLGNSPDDGEIQPAMERLAVRLRDGQGGVWVAKPGGASGGIQPFLVELPSGVTNLVAELVLLKPLSADFLVNTKQFSLP